MALRIRDMEKAITDSGRAATLIDASETDGIHTYYIRVGYRQYSRRWGDSVYPRDYGTIKELTEAIAETFDTIYDIGMSIY
jgi:hypothetical protein